MNDVGVDVDAVVVAFLVMVSGLCFGLFGSDRIGQATIFVTRDADTRT